MLTYFLQTALCANVHTKCTFMLEHQTTIHVILFQHQRVQLNTLLALQLYFKCKWLGNTYINMNVICTKVEVSIYKYLALNIILKNETTKPNPTIEKYKLISLITYLFK